MVRLTLYNEVSRLLDTWHNLKIGNTAQPPMNQAMFLTPIKEIVSSSLMYMMLMWSVKHCIGCWKPPCTAQCIFVSSDHEEDVSHLGSEL